MTRITIHMPAGEADTPKGTFQERFGPHAFDSQLGQGVPFTYEGSRFGSGRLVAAEVAPGGESAELTFDLPVSAPRLEA